MLKLQYFVYIGLSKILLKLISLLIWLFSITSSTHILLLDNPVLVSTPRDYFSFQLAVHCFQEMGANLNNRTSTLIIGTGMLNSMSN